VACIRSAAAEGASIGSSDGGSTMAGNCWLGANKAPDCPACAACCVDMQLPQGLACASNRVHTLCAVHLLFNYWNHCMRSTHQRTACIQLQATVHTWKACQPSRRTAQALNWQAD
jgi:hypothetical protein